MIRVLVVDDSAFMRRSISTLIEKDDQIKVVGIAVNGQDALTKIKDLDPDVVTMDVEMPVMDGITALSNIMKSEPLPVIMVSSLTHQGADTTLRALEIGAVDFIAKEASSSLSNLDSFSKEIIAKIHTFSRRKAFMRLVKRRQDKKTAQAPSSGTLARQGLSPQKTGAAAPGSATARPRPRRNCDIVAIGVSTGGPPAVQKVLEGLPADFPASILIAQHMPAAFTGPFAKRLDGLCQLTVKEAEHGERLRSGHVYICPGGKHLRIERDGGFFIASVAEEPKEAIYKPSANELMESAGLAMGPRALGVMLTGMGSDGLEGSRVLKDKGGVMLAQNEATCVVYGMPKAVIDADLADEVLAIEEMSQGILRYFDKTRP